MYPLLPHLLGWAGIMTFQSPGINPALWGQADGNNLALCPTLHNRKSHRGKCPYVIAPTLLLLWGDHQKVIALHLSLAIPRLSRLVGGRGYKWLVLKYAKCMTPLFMHCFLCLCCSNHSKSLQENMGLSPDLICDPWICSHSCIRSQTCSKSTGSMFGTIGEFALFGVRF